MVALRLSPQERTAPVCKSLSLTAQKMRKLVTPFELVLLGKGAKSAFDGAVLSRVQRAFRLDILRLKEARPHAAFATELLSLNYAPGGQL